MRSEKKSEKKVKDENEIRQELKAELHEHMDQQSMKRIHRMALARFNKDTTWMWDLVAATVEQANIQFHNLQGKEATKMRGRSRITLKKQVKDMLQGNEDDPDETILASRANWLRGVAQDHAAQGNRLINVARRMKAGSKGGTCDAEKRMT